MPMDETTPAIEYAHETCSRHRDHVTRRTVLAAGTSGFALALAGCTSFSEGSTPDPIALNAGQACDDCGMIIEKHPGPVGQAFFEDESPEGHDNPAHFDALKQCMFPYRIERENRGWTVAAQYVTDYSVVEYDVTTDGSESYIASYLTADTFAPAEDLYYVVESEVRGAMGPDFIPFSMESDATAFANEYGGTVVEYDDIGEGLIGK